MLTIQNLSFAYHSGRPVIQNLSLSLDKGCVCGLLGSNGAGKSTLLYLICGLLNPGTGTIDFNGHTPRQRQVCFLNDVFIVPEEVVLPNVLLKDFIEVNAPFYPRFSREEMDRYMELFNLPADLHLGACSMGQKKKAFLSFAIACRTSLLILDEPTNGLDISSKQDFRKAISMTMTDDRIILISTHQVYDVERILDHVVILGDQGVVLNRSIPEITSRLRFTFTTDRDRIARALMAVEVPGGANIVELNDDPDFETDLNLESLYELFYRNPMLEQRIFGK